MSAVIAASLFLSLTQTPCLCSGPPPSRTCCDQHLSPQAAGLQAFQEQSPKGGKISLSIRELWPFHWLCSLGQSFLLTFMNLSGRAEPSSGPLRESGVCLCSHRKPLAKSSLLSAVATSVSRVPCVSDSPSVCCGSGSILCPVIIPVSKLCWPQGSSSCPPLSSLGKQLERWLGWVLIPQSQKRYLVGKQRPW